MFTPTQQTTVTPANMAALLLSAYCLVLNYDDPDGPIDALVPWSAAPVFMDAVEKYAGEKPKCEYVRPNMGHLTSRGRRVVTA